MLWMAILEVLLVWSVTPNSAVRREQAYQISRKPCWINGQKGTCMFVYECIKSEGYHIGMCVDNFMFGSCCAYNTTIKNQHNDNNDSDNVLAHLQHTKPSHLYTASSLSHHSHTTNKPISHTKTTNSHRPLSNNNYLQLSQSNQVHKGTPTLVAETVLKLNLVSPLPSFSITKTTNANSPHNARPIVSLPAAEAAAAAAAAAAGTASPLSSGNFHTKSDWQITTESTAPLIVSLKPNTNNNNNNNNIYWQFTTEPLFITKIKEKISSSNRPELKSTKKPIIQNNTSKLTIKYQIKTTKLPTEKCTTTKRPITPSSIMIVTENSVQKTPTIMDIIQSSDVSNQLIPLNIKNDDCGVSRMFINPQTRIVGGKNAPFGRWPWQVSVRRTSFFGFSSTHRCGGAILNENWIATAGHCVDDLLTSQIRIRVGEYDFSNVQEKYPHIERAVARKVVHPKYNFFTYEYDLALVKLEKNLDFAPHISPICLPASDDLLIGENAVVTGWGRLREGGTLPSILQEVQVPIVSNDRCKNMFLRAGRHEFIPDIFLCAGHENGGQDSCQGDSGGPLQVKGKDGRYFLAGIISWGIGCAEANLPGVCTRISKFVPWILKNVT